MKRKNGDKETPEKNESISSGILHEVGKILGLEGILKKAATMHPIKERLEEIDEEIKQRLSELPAKETGEGGPGVDRGIGRRSVIRARPSGVKRPVRTELEVDIFDEEDWIDAIAVIPGVDEESIEIKLEGNRLDITVSKGGRLIRKELLLPCSPQGELTKTYKNGIFEVRINKKKE